MNPLVSLDNWDDWNNCRSTPVSVVKYLWNVCEMFTPPNVSNISLTKPTLTCICFKYSIVIGIYRASHTGDASHMFAGQLSRLTQSEMKEVA